MSFPDRFDAEFRRLLDEYCSDLLDEAGLRELEAQLLASESARRAFVAYFHLHTELEFAMRAGRAADSALEIIKQRGRVRPGPRTWRRRHVALMSTAAAALVLAGLGLALGLGRTRTGPGPERRPLVAPEARAYPKVDYAHGLAMLLKLEKVEWEPGQGPHPGPGDVLPASRLRLRSGRATLSFFNGVVLIAEGPADFELVSAERVFCRRGRLRTRVPRGAEGFVVASTRSAVMDLGTDFAIDVDDDGKARVLVHEGQTEGAVLSESGMPQRSLRMVPSDLFEINPETGRIASVAGPRPNIAPTPMTAPPLVLDSAYRAQVLASHPWGYWRFESLTKGAVPNEVDGRPVLRASGPVRLAENPGGNRCAEFQSQPKGHYLLMDGSWNPPRGEGYAIEMWVMPEVIRHATLAVLYVPTDSTDDRHFRHAFFTELTALTRQTMHPPGSVRLLHRSPPGSQGGSNLFSHDRYVPYRWHHVVAQVRRGRMELYLNGNANDSLPVDPDDPATNCRFLLGRLTTVPKHSFFTSRPFAGRMDEVALYDHPLSPDEIRLHHAAATQRPGPE
jgi:hypothetical protein